MVKTFNCIKFQEPISYKEEDIVELEEGKYSCTGIGAASDKEYNILFYKGVSGYLIEDAILINQ